MTRTENNILLFSITMCWSAAYIFIKTLPPDLSTYAYLTLTTGIASVVLVIIFWRQLKKITGGMVKKAGVLSLILTIDMVLNKEGIGLLSASNASFLSALTIIVVPLLMLLLRVKPTKNNMLGALIIVLGLGLTSRFAISGFKNMGTLFMLLGCLSGAVYTIASCRFAKEENPLLIGIVQMIFTALSGFALWLIEEPSTFLSIEYTKTLLSSIFILAFFTRAYAYIMLMFSQKYASPINVTVIASTEPVITLLFAVMIPAAFGGTEKLTLFSLSGAMIIALGAVVAGTDFLQQKEKTEKEAECKSAG
jgi:drug/metabolite transporter (DMT)-like permease